MGRRTMYRSLAALMLLISLTTLGFGQGKKKEPAERAVSGVVTNDNGEPVPGAVVQLKNMKTLQVRSFIAKEKGEYYFNGLSTDIDYEFRAEWNGKSSNTRTLSSFDSHPAVVLNLQLK
jgi:Carboxypeptidase regulatory-like domain